MKNDSLKIPDPSKMKPIDPEIFSYGYSIAIATALGKLNPKIKSQPQLRAFIYEKGGAGLLEINAKDRPDVRAIFTAVGFVSQFTETSVWRLLCGFLRSKR